MIKELWYLPRPARNHYPGGFPLHFEKRLFGMYKPQSILQPFGGGALYGTRCDINPGVEPDVVCDAHALPFADNSYDFVLCDPPYSTDLSGKIYHTGVIKEKLYKSEAVRVCKVGGHIGLYHWVMSPRPQGTRFERVIVIIGRVRHHVRICCIFQKVQTLFEVESKLTASDTPNSK